MDEILSLKSKRYDNSFIYLFSFSYKNTKSCHLNVKPHELIFYTVHEIIFTGMQMVHQSHKMHEIVSLERKRFTDLPQSAQDFLTEMEKKN